MGNKPPSFGSTGLSGCCETQPERWMPFPADLDDKGQNAMLPATLVNEESCSSVGSHCADEGAGDGLVSSYHLSDAPLRSFSRHAAFRGSPTHSVHRSEYSVQPYGEIYGMHPMHFDFDAEGQMVPVPECDRTSAARVPSPRLQRAAHETTSNFI